MPMTDRLEGNDVDLRLHHHYRRDGVADDDPDDGATAASTITIKTSKVKSATSGNSRRELPPGAVSTLRAWLLAPEHVTHPYPTPQDQAMLMQLTGIDKKQLKNWFTNARRRIWKPAILLRQQQLQQHQHQQEGLQKTTGNINKSRILQATASPRLAAALPFSDLIVPLPASPALNRAADNGVGLPPGVGVPPPYPSSMPPIMQQQPHLQPHLQQHLQQQSGGTASPWAAPLQQQTHQPQPPQAMDSYASCMSMAAGMQDSRINTTTTTTNGHYYVSQPPPSNTPPTSHGLAPSFSWQGFVHNKQTNDSPHALLMELLAADPEAAALASSESFAGGFQGIVSESQELQMSQQQPPPRSYHTNQFQPAVQDWQPKSIQTMMMTQPPALSLQSVPTLHSWPQFSSMHSLNNLSTNTTSTITTRTNLPVPAVQPMTMTSSNTSTMPTSGHGGWPSCTSRSSTNSLSSLHRIASLASLSHTDTCALLEVLLSSSSSNTNLKGLVVAGSSTSGTMKEGRNSLRIPGGGGAGDGGMDDDCDEIGLSLDDVEWIPPTITNDFFSDPAVPRSKALC